MCLKANKFFVVVAFVLVSIVMALAIRNYAGNTDPITPPGGTSSYTLEDIYQRLNAGTPGAQGTFTEPAGGPGSTMHTLNDIMDKAPVADNTNGATKAEVAHGRKYWSLRTDGSGGSSWGEETGSLYGGCTCSGFITLGRWCDNGDGTVIDMTNCLVWLQKADWGGNKPWREPGDYTHNDDAHTRAGRLCADSTSAGLSDGSVVGDWRLPTKEELITFTNGSWPQSLYDPANVTGLPPDEFGTDDEIWYWTSTTHEDDASKAYFVKLTDEVNTNGKASSISKDFDISPGIYVWPVRNY
jgi:hypothetical protein